MKALFNFHRIFVGLRLSNSSAWVSETVVDKRSKRQVQERQNTTSWRRPLLGSALPTLPSTKIMQSWLVCVWGLACVWVLLGLLTATAATGATFWITSLPQTLFYCYFGRSWNIFACVWGGGSLPLSTKIQPHKDKGDGSPRPKCYLFRSLSSVWKDHAWVVTFTSAITHWTPS